MNPAPRTSWSAPALWAGLFAVLATAPAPAATPVPPPPPADSLARIDSPPAPLIVPGRPDPGQVTRPTREQLAREQYGLARGLEEQGAAAAAIIAYRRAAELDPQIRGAREHIGRLYVAAGQHRAAALEFAAEVRLDPANRGAARALGLALANSGDSTGALRQLELLTRRGPRDTASWKALGYAYGLANRPADAERALRRATGLDPGDAGAWRDLGLVCALRGRPAEARAAYARAAKLAPHDGTPLVNLGNLEARAGRLVAALAAYQEAERRDSTLEAAYDGQVRVLRTLDRAADAGAAYRRWLAVKPSAREARLDAIRHFDAMGRADIALELAREGVRESPKSSEAHVTLGRALEATGDIAGMLDELRKAQRLAREPDRRERLGATIAALRAKAPDSLRAVYAADSLAHETGPARPAGADSTAGR